MDISATPQIAAPTATHLDSQFDIDVSATVLSFDDFYRDHCEQIVRALAATLGDGELAADATNEAMTRAYQRWARISRYDSPAAWVYRVGLNWSLSWKQRRRRERDRPIKLAADVTEMSTRDDSFDYALTTLSLDHRAVVVCRIYLDWSVEQTAQALNVAPGTVKSRLARALSQLRAVLEPQSGEPDVD